MSDSETGRKSLSSSGPKKSSARSESSGKIASDKNGIPILLSVDNETQGTEMDEETYVSNTYSDNTSNKKAKRHEHRTNQAKWEEMFGRLRAFREHHGHCLVPNRYVEDHSLGSWVSTQRRHYKIMKSGSNDSTPMTPQRARRLEALGFKWETKDPRHVPWETRFQQLVEYKEKFGNCLVPVGFKANPPLSNWVSTQRQEYKLLCEGRTSKLTADRVGALQSIGFVWQAQKGGSRKRKQGMLQNGAIPKISTSFSHQCRGNPASPLVTRGAWNPEVSLPATVDKRAMAGMATSTAGNTGSALLPPYPANNIFDLAAYATQNPLILPSTTEVDLVTSRQLQHQQLLQELAIRRENEARIMGGQCLFPTVQERRTSLGSSYGQNIPLGIMDPVFVSAMVAGGVHSRHPGSLSFHPGADRASQLPFANGTTQSDSLATAPARPNTAGKTPELPVVDVPPGMDIHTKKGLNDQGGAKGAHTRNALLEDPLPQRNITSDKDGKPWSPSSALYGSVRMTENADVGRPASSSCIGLMPHLQIKDEKGAALLGEELAHGAASAGIGQDLGGQDDDIFADAD